MTNFRKLINKTSPFKLKEEKYMQKIGLASIGVSLIVIFVIMSLFIIYTKQNRGKELVRDGLTLSRMVANYSVNELDKNAVNKLLEIVNYTGHESGLVYSIITDINQKTIAHTGIRYVDNTIIANRATSSNNPLQQKYKDSITNHTIYEFSRPIYKKGKKEGTVRLGFSEDINPLLSDSDIRGLLLIATLIFALAPIFYYLALGSQRLHSLSITDELTGLYNRRGFFLLAEDSLKLAKKGKKKQMMLYADLDNFKEINDVLSHDVGDQVIKETAAIFKSTFRTSDIIARIGGDEFVVFQAETAEANLDIMVNRLQEDIEIFNAQHNNQYNLSMSIGVTSHEPNSEQSIDELLTEADELMYKHKNSKKNREINRFALESHSFPG
jgi:diguanylate cyclase (GGDEF)-like protein